MKSSKGKTPANGSRPIKKGCPTPGKPPKASRPKDPVEVYCRVRPLKDDELESCVEVPEDTLLKVTPPECSIAFKNGHRNAHAHKFKHVFTEGTDQTDIFDRLGFPLVEDLLQGKNGLLFAYGITNSGKTYTMNGEPDQAGILPRSLDIIFNSIADVQAFKFVFRPDNTNGFDLFTEEEANTEAQKSKPKKISPRMRSEMPDYGDLLRIPEPRKVETGVDEDSNYSVFISYVEIYNNFIYDLLEDRNLDAIKPSAPTSRILREDSSRNMYVSGATEVEVKSTEEAFEVLYRGQKMRRVAHTQLNQESSRSHSVFTVKLVQAPLDHTGKDVLQDKSKVVFSQLSLVDLAGSERTSRTNSHGDRLKEAGNINKDLMVLRTCMETIRENQSSNVTKIVPYRDSKLTHLFRNYFDGVGKVRMVVCISPRSEDYDESIQVMRFAEVTQEVVVDRPETVRPNTGLAPGRKRAYMLYKAALTEASMTDGLGEECDTPPAVAPHPYTLALGVLSIQKYLLEDCSVESFSEFKATLEKRSKIRLELIEDLHTKQSSFKTDLATLEAEVVALRAGAVEHRALVKGRDKLIKDNQELRGIISAQDEQNAQLTADLEQSSTNEAVLSRQVRELQQELIRANQQRHKLTKTTQMYEVDKQELVHELVVEREQLVKTQKATVAMEGHVRQERERFEKLARQMKNKEKDLAVKSDQLRQVKEVIKNSPLVSVRSTLKESNTPISKSERKRGNVPALRGKGRKRSFSENYLEHKPTTTVRSGDLLQPLMKKKKTVSTPRPKDFQSRQVDKYCLQHQEEDSQGDIQTALFKGDIHRTRGGGTSVQFTDVEVLKHSRPKTPSTRDRTRRSTRIASRGRPRGGQMGVSSTSVKSDVSLSSVSSLSSEGSPESSVNEWTDVESRCAVAIEGRPGSATPALTHVTVPK
ncbi:kinesin-like protein KIF23 [Halichondria panicea]|uniref:kinesin-like protein KIF23 n=1 Tax=Halichondria panicea TaxID=6063 RepID=UPI00312BB249